MLDDARASGLRSSGLPLRWKFALFGLPLILVLATAVIAISLLGRLGELQRFMTLPAPAPAPAAAPETSERLVLDEVDGFSVDTFHYDRPTGYVLPVTAPLDTFPKPNQDDTIEDGCTTRQHDWLRSHARPATDSRSSITLVNSRTSGEAIVVRNIRGIGRSTLQGVATIEMRCSPDVPQPQPLQPGILKLGNEDVAVFAGVNEAWTPGQWLESGEAQAPSTPLTYLLEPGEDAHLVLDYVTHRNFTGLLVATVVADGVENEVDLTSGSILVASVVSEHDVSLLVIAGSVHCNDSRFEIATFGECTAAQAEALLVPYRRAELPRQPI